MQSNQRWRESKHRPYQTPREQQEYKEDRLRQQWILGDGGKNRNERQDPAPKPCMAFCLYVGKGWGFNKDKINLTPSSLVFFISTTPTPQNVSLQLLSAPPCSPVSCFFSVLFGVEQVLFCGLQSFSTDKTAYFREVRLI